MSVIDMLIDMARRCSSREDLERLVSECARTGISFESKMVESYDYAIRRKSDGRWFHKDQRKGAVSWRSYPRCFASEYHASVALRYWRAKEPTILEIVQLGHHERIVVREGSAVELVARRMGNEPSVRADDQQITADDGY